MKEITALRSFRLIDAIPEVELLEIVKELPLRIKESLTVEEQLSGCFFLFQLYPLQPR